MNRSDSHRDYVTQRHSDLLRKARAGELAARMGESRLDERRTFLARFRRARLAAA